MLIRMTDIFFVAMGYGQFTALISRNPTFVLLNTSGKVILGTWVPNLDTRVSLPNFQILLQCAVGYTTIALCVVVSLSCVLVYIPSTVTFSLLVNCRNENSTLQVLRGCSPLCKTHIMGVFSWGSVSVWSNLWFFRQLFQALLLTCG